MKRLFLFGLTAAVAVCLSGCFRTPDAAPLQSGLNEVKDLIQEIQEEVKTAGHGAPGAYPDANLSDSTVSTEGSAGQVSGDTWAVDQTLQNEGVTVTLEKLIQSNSGGMFSPPPDGCIYIYPVFNIENRHTSGEALYFGTTFSCRMTVDGEETSFSLDSLLAYDGDIQQMDIDLPQGKSERVMTAFCIPANWKRLEIELNQGFHPLIEPINMNFVVNRP